MLPDKEKLLKVVVFHMNQAFGVGAGGERGVDENFVDVDHAFEMF